MGKPEGNQAGNGETYPGITINKKAASERPSHHETQTGHIDRQITAIKITATLWNWTRLGNDQDSTSQGKNSKGGYENNDISNAHNLDI